MQTFVLDVYYSTHIHVQYKLLIINKVLLSVCVFGEKHVYIYTGTYTVKPRLSELRLSEHSIIRTLRLGPRIIALIYKQPRLSELSIIRTFFPGPNVFG